MPASDDVELYLRTDSSNGASFDAAASDYAFGGTGISESAGGLTNACSGAGTPQAFISLNSTTATAAVGNASNEGCAGIITIEKKGDSSAWPIIGYEVNYLDASSRARYNKGSATRRTAATINAIQLLFESGNIASGTVKIYGITNS